MFCSLKVIRVGKSLIMTDTHTHVATLEEAHSCVFVSFYVGFKCNDFQYTFHKDK